MSKKKEHSADVPTPKRRGRPSAFSMDVAVDICARLLMRDENDNLPTLRDLCRSDPTLPAEGTVYKWMAQNAEFGEMYARTREERAHMVADEIIHIADTEEDPNKARIRIDARKWWVGKANAKHYGDKSVVDLNVKRDPATMTDAELESIAAASRDGVATAAPGSALTH